jgi:predicted enzyme related to lactoylglutathione lyase
VRPTTGNVVHLELHTSDRAASSRFYADLLQWRTERIDTEWGSYHALDVGSGLDGGIGSHRRLQRRRAARDGQGVRD